MPKYAYIMTSSLLLLLGGCNIEVINEGGGLVTSGDGKINCGEFCSASYPEDQTVILNATADEGFAFEGWSGVCTGSEPCTITVGPTSGHRNVTAEFVPIELTTYSIGGSFSGLVGSVQLSNNDDDFITIFESDLGFEFPTQLIDEMEYNIEVVEHPENQLCLVTNGAGIVDQKNITDIVISCLPTIGDVSETLITTSPTIVTADGVSTSTIFLQVKDTAGNDISVGGDSIILTQNGSATISAVSDNNDGTYSTVITNTVAETIVISGTLRGNAIVETATVTFVPGQASTIQSTISTLTEIVILDMTFSTNITIQAKDSQGNHLNEGGLAIFLSQTGSATISSITDNNDGTYTAVVSNTIAETIVINGTMNGVLMVDTATITFLPFTPAM